MANNLAKSVLYSLKASVLTLLCLSNMTYAVQSAVTLRDSLRVTEVMYNPVKPTGSTFNNDDFEFIEIKNVGQATVDLMGVAILDGVEFYFAAGVVPELAPGEFVLVVRSLPAFQSRYGTGLKVAGTYTSNLKNDGDTISLLDSTLTPLIQWTYDDTWGWPIAADGLGHSLVPIEGAILDQPNGSLDYGRNWRSSTHMGGSPGKDDPPIPTGPMLNEFAAHTDTIFPPPRDSNDWIEIFNTSNSPIELYDYWLSDDPLDLKKWLIPQGKSIPANGRMSFDEISDFHNPIDTGFGLNKAGEQIFLSHLPGTEEDRIVDAVRFKGQKNGLTWGRYPDGGEYWDLLPPTRDAADEHRMVSAVINEVMYRHPTDVAELEFVELHNPTSGTVSLWNEVGPWHISGGIEFDFPTDASIPAGGYLLVIGIDPTDAPALSAFKDAYGIAGAEIAFVGPYKGSLSNKGDRISLEIPEASDDPLAPDAVSWITADEIIYFDRAPWPSQPDGRGSSLQRSASNLPGNDPTNWATHLPNPGSQAPRDGRDYWLVH